VIIKLYNKELSDYRKLK